MANFWIRHLAIIDLEDEKAERLQNACSEAERQDIIRQFDRDIKKIAEASD